jgi:hypothetical protein
MTSGLPADKRTIMRGTLHVQLRSEIATLLVGMLAMASADIAMLERQPDTWTSDPLSVLFDLGLPAAAANLVQSRAQLPGTNGQPSATLLVPAIMTRSPISNAFEVDTGSSVPPFGGVRCLMVV